MLIEDEQNRIVKKVTAVILEMSLNKYFDLRTNLLVYFIKWMATIE